MDYYGAGIGRLIESLQSLPGIGAKSAQRLAFHLISMPEEQVRSIADSMVYARENVHFCHECQTLTDGDLCPICASSKRDHSVIMVVENSRDLAAYERTGGYDGVYHVLQGVISPLLGVGPNDIRLKELMQRLQDAVGETPVQEVIIATSSTVEGESTAMYIARLIRMLELPVKITRIASGVPVGGDIENVDEVTLERALKGRTEL